MVVSAEYRLLPESTGSDIHDDIEDFWAWLRSEFQSVFDNSKPGLEANLEKVIVWGASVGGTLAIQSGFYQPAGFIKAVIAAYPGIAVGVKRDRPILGAPTVPPHVLEDFLKKIKPGEIVTSAEWPARMQIALSLVQQTRTREFYGEDDRLYPMKVLEKAETMPYTLIIHGEDDTAIPVGTVIAFARAVRGRFGEGKVDLRIMPGAEHGFDTSATFDVPWLKEGLSKVTELWLGGTEE
jgi:acetyl esterase/lipase